VWWSASRRFSEAIVIARLDDDQVAMLNRLLADHHTTVDLNLTDPGNARVREHFMPLISMLERADVSNG